MSPDAVLGHVFGALSAMVGSSPRSLSLVNTTWARALKALRGKCQVSSSSRAAKSIVQAAYLSSPTVHICRGQQTQFPHSWCT
eukprot:2746695-Prymnesium_polylepis.1